MNKTLVTLLAFALTLCCGSTFGQSANCSYITYSLVSDDLKINPGCDVNFNQQVTETQTYNVTCVNTNTGGTYFTASPQPQKTSTGQTSQFCGGPTPINCSPVFEPQNVNASSYPGNNQFYLRVWNQVTSGSQCTRTGFQQNFQQCAAIQCTTTGGGGSSGPTDAGLMTCFL